MTRTRIAVALLALAACAATVAAEAAPRVARIHYAEPIALPDLPSLPAAGMQKPTGPVHTSFDAFGRRFDLQLESNDRVLRRLSPAARATLPGYALYAGTVVGLPGSWVRLTRLGSGLQGLVFDGSALYVLAPAGAVRSELDIPMPGLAQTATVIYRAADVDSGLGPDFCRVLAPTTSESKSGSVSQEPAYKAIFAELATNASAIASTLPSKELDLALIGDSQLAAAIPGTTGEMLARLNNVDGIFSAQVGVRITSGFVKVLTNNGGMTASAADQLLDQLDSYRKVTPEAASRGAAHLMTGRDLDGPTVGIAYLGTLCESEFAVSLSQTYLDTYNSSLVAAHELGHSFGAPHDGASGTACATTPQVFLMAPAINGSSTFSQCSLDQIAPHVTSATCLTPAKYADVGVEFASASLSAYSRQDVHVPVDVVSGGELGVDQTVLTLNTSATITIRGATVTGGTCAANDFGWTCQLGSLAAGTRRQVDVVVRGDFIATGQLLASVRASADTDPSNNSGDLQITFSSAADGSVVLSSNSLSAYVGETQSFYVTASNAGPLALENATVVMQKPGLFTVVSAGGTGVPCTTTPAEITCTIGTLPAGQSRRIDVSLVGTQAWGNTVPVSIRSTNDDVYANDQVSLTILALPLVELTLTAEPGPTLIKIGGTITQSFTLRSAGPEPVNGATFTLDPSLDIEIVSVVGSGAVCGPTEDSQRTFRCTYASPIEASGSRRLDATIKALSSLSAVLIATATAPDSQHLDSNRGFAVLQYQLRSDVDVRLSTLFNGAAIYDHRAVTLRFDVDSIGLTPATNSRFTLSLPAGLRATDVQTTLGSCSISTASVECSLGSLSFGAISRILVTVIGDDIGSYTVNAVATSDGDSDASNGATSVQLDASPNVDLSLGTLPATTHVRVGSTIDYPVAVAAASHPVSSAIVAFTVNGGVTAVGVTTSQGNCEAVSRSFRCTLGTLAANGTATVTLRLRGDTPGSNLLDVHASGAGDIDIGNDSRTGTIVVDQRGNVSVQSAAAKVAATVGLPFDLPRVTATAITPTQDVHVTFSVPAAFSIDSATADGAPCAVNAGTVNCEFGTLDAGMSRGIAIRLRPIQAGSFAVKATAVASDDSDTGDNSAGISISVGKSGSGSSGGGGGGSLDRDSLLLMLLLAPAVLGRRRNETG